MVVNELYYGSVWRDTIAPIKAERLRVGATAGMASGVSISDDIIAAALRNIYRRDFNPATEIEPNLFNAVAESLGHAVTAAVPSGSPLGEDPFFHALRHSTDVFSAFKVHRAQNDMAARLLDSNGNLKPFEQWKQEVLPIADHQCHNWLETEYNTAVLRARQAANWQQFQAEKDILPNLKWLPSTSPNPGEDHRPFWNTVLPIDHPFWDQHRPGDRWNCKCDLTSTDEPPTPVPGSSSVGGDGIDAPQPGLTDNPGKTQAVFSDDHPYFPKECNRCPFYNPTLQARLSRVFKAQGKKGNCNSCPYVDTTLGKVANTKANTAIHVKEIKAKLDKYEGGIVADGNYLTGQIRVLRGSIQSVYEHSIEDENVRQWLLQFSEEGLKGWKYEGWAENRPYEPNHPKFDPKNPQRKKHPETDFFLYYSKEIGGQKYWANVKMHKDYKGEVLYTIEPNKPEDLIEGLPPNIEKYQQK